MKIARAWWLACLLLPGLCNAAVLKLYMAPSGVDTRNGLSEAQAVKTLNRVQEILQQTRPTDAVEIHISPGTYLGQSVLWRYVNGQSITFTPTGFASDVNNRPVFDGQGKDYWFTLDDSLGHDTHLNFRYLKVQNYNTAMSFEGNRNSVNAWNGGNSLYNMYFYRIGGIYSTAGYSTAAVRFVNSRDNSIQVSHFINVENAAADAAHLHAIYAAHYSSGNLIQRNKFANVNGDPIRFRDASDGNLVSDNRFYTSGLYSAYSEWFCEASRPDCTKPTPECPSFVNEFRRNRIYSGYNGAQIPTFALYGDINACGTATRPRLYTSENVNPATD